MEALRLIVRLVLWGAAGLAGAAVCFAINGGGMVPALLLPIAAVVVRLAAGIDSVRLDWLRRILDARGGICVHCQAVLDQGSRRGDCPRCGRGYDMDETERAAEHGLRWGPGGPILGWNSSPHLSNQIARSRTLRWGILFTVVFAGSVCAYLMVADRPALVPLAIGALIGLFILSGGEGHQRRAHLDALRNWLGREQPECDGCGHSLENLPPAGRCPECGREYDLPRKAERARREIEASKG